MTSWWPVSATVDGVVGLDDRLMTKDRRCGTQLFGKGAARDLQLFLSRQDGFLANNPHTTIRSADRRRQPCLARGTPNPRYARDDA